MKTIKQWWERKVAEREWKQMDKLAHREKITHYMKWKRENR